MKPISYKAPAYALIFPRIAETVRPFGYAATIHGSMANDLDIVLIPWVDGAAEPAQVAQVVYEMIEACFAEKRLPLHGPEVKPHGRVAWTIPLLAGCSIDLSIMPVIKQTDTAVPDGWEIKRTDSKPFRSVAIKAPNGFTAEAYSTGRNPENVLYMLADALLGNTGTC